MEHKGRLVANSKIQCVHCAKVTTKGNVKKHQDSCYLNPDIVKYCLECNAPIKNYKSSKGTCSRSCANKYFRSGIDNGNWKGEKYQSICFMFHKKECVVCGENKIVAVHHYDHNHDNNDHTNLVPLCPTHHSYVHSRYVGEIQHIIDAYVDNYKLGVA